MTLTELLTTLAAQGAIHPARVKDMKVSIRYLATALQCPSPESCTESHYHRSEEVLGSLLDQYFATRQPPASTITIRNTKSNIRSLFKQAVDKQLLQPLGPKKVLPGTSQAQEAAERARSPYRARYTRDPYELKRALWPPDIDAAWTQFVTAHRRALRPYTIRMREAALRKVLGFLHHVAHQPLPSWADLFRVELLDQFVTWHSERVQVRLTTTAEIVVASLCAIAKHIEHPNFAALANYRRRLGKAEPMHNKHDHWFTREELEQVALGDLEDARKPLAKNWNKNQSPRVTRAMQHSRALMLRLLLRVPLRQRNLREMCLNRNLSQDARGHWILRFQGEELKVTTRQGKTNAFEADLTTYFPEIIPHLSEYLETYRPLFPRATEQPYVFLSQAGTPFTPATLYYAIYRMVLRRTDKHFYPHLIRTLWFSEFVDEGGDAITAAFMLNDSPQTALLKYHEFLNQKHLERASAFSKGFSPRTQ